MASGIRLAALTSLLAFGGTAALAAAEEGEKAGMPQLDFGTYPNQIFWLVVTLLVLYFLLSRIALPRIASILSERQGAIARDLEQAEELRRKAVAAEEAYKQALADARAEANQIIAEAKAEIQKEIDAANAKAEAEIAARTAESEKRIAEIRSGMMQAVEDVARDTAVEIIDAILPGIADPKLVADTVAAKVKE
ncbi:MAG: F0F1 ATP synthase subunit B' [Paracoccaceae bacterium]|nr:F0F1 ATP synthase subunit B' [Paracoccaceae bacterium]